MMVFRVSSNRSSNLGHGGATGKQWVLTGFCLGEVCEIVQVSRMIFGERYSRDIRSDIAEDKAAAVETSEVARASLSAATTRSQTPDLLSYVTSSGRQSDASAMITRTIRCVQPLAAK